MFRSLQLGDLNPLLGLGGFQDRIKHQLSFQGIPESGGRGPAGFQPLEEIGNLMGKAGVIADRQARYPPLVPVLGPARPAPLAGVRLQR
jgi:hypothetical protein